MKTLDLLSCRQFVFGAAALAKGQHGIAPTRMTPELRNLYSYNEAALIRADSLTNIRIRFKTDSKKLAIGIWFGAVARPVYAVDVLVPGEKMLTIEPDAPGKPLDKTIAIPGKGMRDVTIMLPNLVVAEITRLELDDDASVEDATPYKGKLVVVGDSILQGMTTTTPAKAIASLVGEAMGCDIHNIAVGGAVMRPEAAELSKALGGNMIIVGFGVNDFAQSIPLDEFTKRTQRTAEILAADSRKAVVITPIPYPGYTGPNSQCASCEDYRDCIRKVLRAFPGIALIEGTRFFPNDKSCFVDSCHPNDKGSMVYADALAKTL